MNEKTFGAAITLLLPDEWPAEAHEAVQRFREFFWPPGAEDSDEALGRRAALAVDTGLHGVVNALHDLDDRVLFSVLALLGKPNAFLRSFAAIILLRETGLGETMDDMARHVLETTPPPGLVQSMTDYYADIDADIPDEILACVRTSHGLVRP